MALLVEAFLSKMRETTNRMLKRQDDPLLKTGMHAIASAVQYGDKVFFAESTMLMLAEKLEHFEQTLDEVYAAVGHRDLHQAMQNVQSFRGGWLEFTKPIDQCKAMLCFVPSVYIPTGKDQIQLYLIDVHAEIIEALEEQGRGKRWVYQELLHHCPLCTREHGVLVLCEHCQQMLIAWGRIFGLSAIIAGQYLAALRYEEREVTGIRHVPRQKSKGKKKSRPIKYLFKVIDANEIIIPIQTAEPEQRQEKRGSWLDSDTIYEEIRTRPFIRTYRHPRYVNMRGQTVSFPDGIKRLQPRKGKYLGKHITKVVASDYEE